MADVLHDYQVRAIEHLHRHDGAGLFLDMGLGKTAAVLSALEPRHLPALVVGPKRVAEQVWRKEIERWRPDLSLAQATGSPAQRAAALAVPADVTVMTRDTIADLPLAVRKAFPYRTLVLDELSGYKTKGTARWRETRKRVPEGGHVWGLTGTPAPNGLMDLWAQVYLLDGGARLGRTLDAYRNRYFYVARRHKVTNVVIEWGLKPGAEEAIHRKIADICLSMRKEDYLPDLPEQFVNEVEVPLPTSARRVIADLRATLVADLGILGTYTAANGGVLSNRLRQASAGFLYADGDTSRHVVLHEEKARAAREVVDGTGSPILMLYAFQAERDALLRAIPQARTVDSPGVFDDWDRGTVPVLLAHPASIGHGLNLQHGGHVAVWASLTWSLEEWEQTNDRLHRQGQKHDVLTHVLISPGTPDRQVLRALREKASVEEAVMSYLREDHLLL